MGCLKSKEKDPEPEPVKEPEPKKVDPRLPFETYRQLFNMKNSWKVVNRGLENNAKQSLIRLLEKHPEYKSLFKEVGDKDPQDLMDNPNFEMSATDLYTIIDEAMEATEKVDFAIQGIQMHGKSFQSKGFPIEFFTDMEESFLWNASEVLGDRYTDATEKNFKLLYGFVYKHICEAYGVTMTSPDTGDSNRV